MRAVWTILCVLLSTASACENCGPAFDGNPHQWDRRRRCDHTEYSPPCGVCEGYGGIPTGDKNEEITLTSCEPVASASEIDPATLVKPVWGSRWTSKKYYEILIGKKTDPFCFQTFPGNDSIGELCYRPDFGVQSYDMEKYNALREDLTLKMSVGDVQCEVLHQGKEFWVVNKYPWYAAGVHQCICTQAHEGADKSKPAVYPVQYNWTQQMFYIGREKIGIEYLNQVRVLDHWAWGPHHAWSEPSNGTLVRLWQPFNGLQIFGDVTGTNPGTVDEKVFQDIPPALCKKGGATFRINCDDDGYYKPKENANEKLTSPSAASLQDIKRAKTVVPRKEYRGMNFENMSAVLNNWIASGSATFRACDDWNLDELQALQAMLYLVRNADFDSIYTTARDNRRLVNETLEDIKATWAELNQLVEGHPAESKLKNIVRDAHCHESVMWYVHHLSEDTKSILGETGVEIPLLSLAPHHENGGACAQSQQDETHEKVCRLYAEKVSCAACHSNALPPKEASPGRKARFNL